VAHAVFTSKHREAGDDYPRIVELPVFGHSGNYAGIQIADLLCSALLFPLAVHSYCTGHITNVHTRPGYHILQPRYGERIEHLQHRSRDVASGRSGGLVVRDELEGRSSWHLLRSSPPSTHS